uniref:Ricin B lectin domain-containing protein n=1 Tax=Timema poppense TaxID=170557 RepID=A0A7R9GVA4_TIMPO|nr:unnamed protein product [Timema poppensis]
MDLRLSNTSLCVTSEKGVEVKGSRLILKPCLRIKNQTDKSELVLAQLLCLDANDQFPRLSKCHEMGGSQEWRHQGESETLVTGKPLWAIIGRTSGTCGGEQSLCPRTPLTHVTDIPSEQSRMQAHVANISRLPNSDSRWPVTQSSQVKKDVARETTNETTKPLRGNNTRPSVTSIE